MKTIAEMLPDVLAEITLKYMANIKKSPGDEESPEADNLRDNIYDYITIPHRFNSHRPERKHRVQPRAKRILCAHRK